MEVDKMVKDSKKKSMYERHFYCHYEFMLAMTRGFISGFPNPRLLRELLKKVLLNTVVLETIRDEYVTKSLERHLE